MNKEIKYFHEEHDVVPKHKIEEYTKRKVPASQNQIEDYI